ncbi:hypothetical protein [Microbacterium sp. cf332]|uniref:hypothetical protein n=1 Tax=Microbacterium sp. cf332 TaxID=1761804 RepID=UPI00087F47E0|nr:hypothetical protein [Microbacterium sp. cf332]SDQ12855.1 hypothetical protein SAMN04487847_0498 [Microbacterium sp. cf332]
MTVDTSAEKHAHRTPTWLIATVAGAFGLFYAYAVWVAVGHLVTQATGVLGLNGLGWAVLGSAIVFPILVFAGAFALGHRRGAGSFALILLAGLGLTAVFWLNILSYSITQGGSLLGS